MPEKEMWQIIADLFNLNQVNKDFLKAHVLECDDIIDKYKERLDKCLYPTSMSHRVNIAGARKIVSEFTKSTKNTESILDLLLYYCETGTDFCATYSADMESYYDSITSVFSKFLKNIEEISEN